jgi:hypothetical protein
MPNQKLVAKHVNNNGTIDWQGVAGENNNYHDHWVDSIGEIKIENFDSAEGDELILRGHTVQAMVLEDSDGVATIGVISDQGNDDSRGNGAHDLDVLGIVEVHHSGDDSFGNGKQLNRSIVDDISNNQFSGVVDNINELPTEKFEFA